VSVLIMSEGVRDAAAKHHGIWRKWYLTATWTSIAESGEPLLEEGKEGLRLFRRSTGRKSGKGC